MPQKKKDKEINLLKLYNALRPYAEGRAEREATMNTIEDVLGYRILDLNNASTLWVEQSKKKENLLYDTAKLVRDSQRKNEAVGSTHLMMFLQRLREIDLDKYDRFVKGTDNHMTETKLNKKDGTFYESLPF